MTIRSSFAVSASLPHGVRLASTLGLVAAALAGCQAPPAVSTDTKASTPMTGTPSTPGSTTPPPRPSGPPPASLAANPKAYREDAARHLYALNAQRIYQGKLPPMLYAIGVLNVDIDHTGKVTALRWLRIPQHAPEIMAEVERTVRAAAPYPVPMRMGKVTYTETWLWDKSGRFQLDTLSEGQLE